MSLHSLAGIAALNLLFLVVGLTAVWAVAGLTTWGAVGRLAGVAYFVGLALGPSQPMLATSLDPAASLLAVTMFGAVPVVQPK